MTSMLQQAGQKTSMSIIYQAVKVKEGFTEEVTSELS